MAPSVVVPPGGDAFIQLCEALGAVPRHPAIRRTRAGKLEVTITRIAGEVFPATIEGHACEIMPFLHPNRAQKGWDDERQQTELYGRLADLIR